MERHGLSQAQLSQRLAVNPRTVSHWARGEVDKVDARSLAQIFELAGLSLDREFGLPGEQPVDAGQVFAKLDALDRKVDGLIHVSAAARLLKGERLPAWEDDNRILDRALQELRIGVQEIEAASTPPQRRKRRPGDSA
jgi:transcriptional regulator with XRE-family HTH domain